ncbi:cytochrome c3 family protein [Candidatus Moduliflexota bacterium]
MTGSWKRPPCAFTAALFGLAALAVLLQVADSHAAEGGGCGGCHDVRSSLAGAQSMHPPFDNGECDSCHLDHGEKNNLLLSADGNALCEECHDTSDGGFGKAHNGFTGTKASCRGCHHPHGSTLRKLLRPRLHNPVAEGKCKSCHLKSGKLLVPMVGLLCQSCHSRDRFAGASVHEPVGKGKCLSCHDPHGSAERALLKVRYSEERWLQKGEEEYRLCLQCHQSTSFTEEQVQSGTNFRNGGLNLHGTHVKGAGGESDAGGRSQRINCRNCHEAHSSPGPHLMRSELDCGGVLCLKLNYRSLPNGGECRSGCHGVQTYAMAGEVRESPAFIDREETRTAGTPEVEEGPAAAPCRSCHDTVSTDSTDQRVHLPVKMGDCSICHLDHGSKNRLVLVSEEEDFCWECHSRDRDSTRKIHGGYSLEGALCSECHDPHSSGKAGLIYDNEHDPFLERDCAVCHSTPSEGWKVPEVSDLCLGCHDDAAGGSVLHEALSRTPCTGCHKPHASEIRSLLREEVPELCFPCHQEDEFTRHTIHSPVKDGSCLACHHPHGGEQPGLFTAPYPFEQHVTFDSDAYALCWKCHYPSLADIGADSPTQFKKGESNLHALHVRDSLSTAGGEERASPGISCRNCHAPHSSNMPHLIRQTLDCGGTPCLELEFRKMGFYGTCLKGCHAKQSYSP